MKSPEIVVLLNVVYKIKISMLLLSLFNTLQQYNVLSTGLWFCVFLSLTPGFFRCFSAVHVTHRFGFLWYIVFFCCFVFVFVLGRECPMLPPGLHCRVLKRLLGIARCLVNPDCDSVLIPWHLYCAPSCLSLLEFCIYPW